MNQTYRTRMLTAGPATPSPMLRGEPINLHFALHVLRNPFGYTPEELRLVRLWAADELERLAAVAANTKANGAAT